MIASPTHPVDVLLLLTDGDRVLLGLRARLRAERVTDRLRGYRG
ncbi:hypothetical protein [Paractinoplanes globisporus]|uniref:Uncharacterized protein n=1 Tax=Paractinoplanes globisporus TaxID=113565 RepID=A0ABW6WVB6_9ACTN|nr:hypothetical protein [Actinoplanes globisporus]